MTGNKKSTKKSTRKSHKSGEKSHKSTEKLHKSGEKKQYNRENHSYKMDRKPKTRVIISHRSRPRVIVSRANSNMSITDLQFMAKSKGIPFGGLKKSQLIAKINQF